MLTTPSSISVKEQYINRACNPSIVIFSQSLMENCEYGSGKVGEWGQGESDQSLITLLIVLNSTKPFKLKEDNE